MKHQYKPLLLLSLIFLMVGSLFCMNDILLPSLITNFKLNYTQATMIQVAFYLTYILFPIPIAWMIHKYGYKVSLLVAVVSCAIGCAFFLPAKYFNSYPLVLLAIFVISTGITIINVAANPFATLLGDPEGSHQRINFVQVFSRVGYAATPLVATALIYNKAGEVRFDIPYLLLAICLLIIAHYHVFFKSAFYENGGWRKIHGERYSKGSDGVPAPVLRSLCYVFLSGCGSLHCGLFHSIFENSIGFQ